LKYLAGKHAPEIDIEAELRHEGVNDKEPQATAEKVEQEGE